ncbi:hypothetical protein ACFVXE_34155 [Streptomyces sp. NPDC058231]|uniref:hypothetical protein n=1 Tax=Streptomyces sp. NPDC058231 TaxID=3346392 RepID=UPI0036E88E3A
MLGPLIRLLPFWVREPLLIALSIPFSGFLFHAAARDGKPLLAALRAVVLVFTAIRVNTLSRLLRARRSLAGADGA